MFINSASKHSILGLDDLDLEILGLLAEGFTNEEIAIRVNLNQNKVLTIRKKC